MGVKIGSYAQHILDMTSPKKLYLIDKWEDDEEYNHCLTRFDKQQNISIHKEYIEFELLKFPNQYFDWVYLDACHEYDSMNWFLHILKYKVKPDGYINGHGFDCRFGAIKSIFEFMTQNNYELKYLALSEDGHHSYSLKKMNV